MVRMSGIGALLAGIMLTTGCMVLVDVPKTYVKAQNDLYNLDVSGTTVSDIDLTGVTIGDITFSAVDSRTTTSAVETFEEGTVDVTIDEADVYVLTFGVSTYWGTLTGLDPMITTITPEITNTVTFDETTAGTILAGIAKKMAKPQ